MATLNEDKNKSGVSRRRVLGGIGAATALGATGLLPIVMRGSTEPAQAASATSEPQRRWGMVIDLRKCEGCVTTDHAPLCVESCNAEHFVPKGQEWIQVFAMEDDDGDVEGNEFNGDQFYLPRICMQCENAPCVKVCPVGATYHSEDGSGIVLVNHNRCIGCRMCMAACPYGVRRFNWEKPENPPGAVLAKYSPEYPIPHRQGTVEKCMLCAHRVKDGKLPACASGCPMFAIYLADMNQDIATNGKEVVKFSHFLSDNSAYRLKEELGTRPRVWYLPGHGQESNHDIDAGGIPKKPRSWQEQGATLGPGNQPQHDHGSGGSQTAGSQSAGSQSGGARK